MSPEMQHYLIPLLIIVPIVLLRLRGLSRKQPLKLGRLWIRPAFLLVVAMLVLFVPQPGAPAHRFAAMDLAVFVPAILLGAIGGWFLGRTMAIDVHPEDGTLMVQASPLGLLVLLGLVAMRFGVRAGTQMEAQVWHLDAGLVFDGLILFTVALFTVRSLEMYLRARRVMQARAVAGRQTI